MKFCDKIQELSQDKDIFSLNTHILLYINNYNSVRAFPCMSVYDISVLCDIDKYNAYIGCYLTYALDNLIQIELDKILSKMKMEVIIKRKLRVYLYM